MRGGWYPSPLEMPGYVSGIIADVDGRTPTPWRVGTSVPPSGAAYLTPDRRAEHAVLVELAAHPGVIVPELVWHSSMGVTVGGDSLVEETTPLGALVSVGGVPPLAAPVAVSSSTPLALSRAALAGGLPVAAVPVTATWLGCSAAAARRVEAALGRARWWGLGAELNVERGGRVLRVAGYQATAPSSPSSADLLASVYRDGRQMVDDATFGVAPATTTPAPVPALAHDVEPGQIYRATLTLTPGASGYLWMHGAELRR